MANPDSPAEPMMATSRLRVCTLRDGKTVPVLVSGMSKAAFDKVGEQLKGLASGHGAKLQRRDLRQVTQTSAELSGFDNAWLVEDGAPDQLVAVIGELLGCELQE